MKNYKMDDCNVIVSIDEGKYHLSISKADSLPTYEEIKKARYKYLPDGVYMAEIYPPKREFINLHNHCRHLFQID